MKTDLKVNRRRFLAGSGGLLMGTLLFSSGPIALLAPSKTWALEMNVLGDKLAKNLLSVIRRIYPHDGLEDAVYAFVIKALDERASTDPSTLPLLEKGMTDLNKASGGDWSLLDEHKQVALLTDIEDSQFFSLVRSVSANSLYSNELAYQHFGYEGASFSKGGYLMRGFNDLKWLPAAPSEASPPPFS